MVDSILTSTKKLLGMDEDYTAFDPDVIMHINTTLSKLVQIGIGPENGFMIEDKTSTWEQFLGEDEIMNMAKSYLYIQVRLLFDPPTSPHHLTALKEQATELEVRLNVQREMTHWVSPFPVDLNEDDPFEDETIIDAGTI